MLLVTYCNQLIRVKGIIFKSQTVFGIENMSPDVITLGVVLKWHYGIMEGVQGFSEDIVLVFKIVTIRKGCVKNCLKLRDVINGWP